MARKKAITITIPADYREEFRMGVLADLKFDAGSAFETFQKFSEQQMCGYPATQPDAVRLDEDHERDLEYITDTAELVASMGEWPATGDVEVRGRPEAIYHALHELLTKIAGPMLNSSLQGLPVEPAGYERWRDLTDWAIREVERAQKAI